MSQTVYGYIRVSSKDQNIERQRKELIAYGVAPRRIYMDKLSGKDFNRPGYQKLTRRKVKPGDLIVVQSLDRLGRNYEEILEEWKWITRTRKVHIKILDMPILDTSVDQDLVGTLICNLVLELLSFVAENERKMIRHPDRQGKGCAFRPSAAGGAAGVHAAVSTMAAEKPAIQGANCPKRNVISEILPHLPETPPAGNECQPLNRGAAFFLSSAKLCRLFPNFRFRGAQIMI